MGMENLADMGARRPGGERAVASSFSATCRRLSQYLKEKGGFGELSLAMGAATRRVERKPETLRTLNLLPGVEASAVGDDDGHSADRSAASDQPMDLFPRRPVMPEPNREHKTAQMTIFYGGKLVVFNNFPVDKARELMDMAGRECLPPSKSSPVEQAAPEPVAPPQHHPSLATPVAPTSETTPAAAAAAVDAVATPAVGKQEEAPKKPPPPATSDLPIARRVSLNRFLEKRKDRITAKAPYQVNTSSVGPGSSSSPPAKGDGDQQWLGPVPQAAKPEENSAGGWRRPAKPAAISGCDVS